MMIEIRGLSDTVLQARNAIKDVREQASGLRDDTKALAATLRDVRASVNKAHEDLKFEAQTLGNSPAESSTLSKPAAPSAGPADPLSRPAPLGGYQTVNSVNNGGRS